MTEQLAPADPSVRAFDATVTAVDGREVVLDRTYFYAESGGQPADRGTLGGVAVEDVQMRDDEVVHTLAEAPDVAADEAVTGEIDDAFRTYCMRAHTASHALYGAGRRLLEDLGYGGFDIAPDKVRVDFTTTTDIDDAVLVELERLVNRAVWDSRPVTWERTTVEEARSREEVAFNTKTEEGVMADADGVRIVTIGEAGVAGAREAEEKSEPWDVAACGGTHVSNTREIGPVEVLSRSNPGEGLTRVEFAVGPTGIDRRATVRTAAFDAARTLGTGVDGLADEVARLREERNDLEAELADYKNEVLAARLAGLDAVERDGRTWRVGTISGFGPNEVSDPTKELLGADEDGDAAAVVVAGEQGSTFVVVASAGDPEAGAVVDRVTDAFGGGGGGGPTFAQGGGLNASPEEVVEFVRE